jgi:hypothetical protein
MPNDDFDERPGIKHVPFVEQQFRLHVGVNTNSGSMLSITPTR